MQLRRLGCIVVAAVMNAAPLVAQSDAEGVISLRYLFDEGGVHTAGFGDFTLSVENGPWYGGLGMYGVVGRLHETYADVGYRLPQVSVLAGFPRPAYDSFAVSPLDSVLPRLAVDRVGVTRSRTTYGTMVLSEYLPYGAVVAGNVGDTRLSGSLHAVPDYDDTILGLAGSFAEGPWQLDVAVERLGTKDGDSWNSKAQLRFVQDDAQIGLGLFAPSANDQPDTAEIFAQVSPVAPLTITGLIRGQSGQAPLVVAGGHLGLTETTSADLGLASQAHDAAVEVGITFRF